MFNQSLLREMASPEAKPCHVAPVPVTRAASEGYLNEYLDATFVRALLVPATMRLLGGGCLSRESNVIRLHLRSI